MQNQNWKGIPAAERKAVQTVIKELNPRMSPQRAYRTILDWRKETAAKKAAQSAEETRKAAARAEAEKQDNAKAVKEAIINLATLRDFMQAATRGAGVGCLTPEDSMRFAYCALKSDMETMEQALFDLGVIEGEKGLKRGSVEGWFNEQLAA